MLEKWLQRFIDQPCVGGIHLQSRSGLHQHLVLGAWFEVRMKKEPDYVQQLVQVTVTSYSKPCGARYLFNKKNTIYIIPYVQLLLSIYSPTIYCVLQSSWAFLAG